MYCFCTKRGFEEGIDYMYRVSPVANDDSGWNFFSKYDDEYPEEEDIALLDLSTVFREHSYIRDIISDIEVQCSIDLRNVNFKDDYLYYKDITFSLSKAWYNITGHVFLSPVSFQDLKMFRALNWRATQLDKGVEGVFVEDIPLKERILFMNSSHELIFGEQQSL